MTAGPAAGAAAIEIRAVREADGAGIGRLLDGLDEDARYRRWFTGGVDIASATRWAAHPDRVGATGLVALVAGEVVGHAVLAPAGEGRGEVAFEVAADWRHHGVATALLAQLLAVAAGQGLREVYAEVLDENADMLAVLREHGPCREHRDGGSRVLTLPVART